MQNKVRSYICDNYKVKTEFPWKQYPEFQTFKSTENDKWFALLMHVKKRVLGYASEEKIWILNVKCAPDFGLINGGMAGILPGYHMNKENWISILLDGSVPFENIKNLIEISYNIVEDTPSKRIYEAVKKIPKGKVATYKQVAYLAGNPKMSRAVGNALHKNPDPVNIPCYRVVNSKGELAKAFAFGGENVQKKLLEADGIVVVDGKVDLDKYGFISENI